MSKTTELQHLQFETNLELLAKQVVEGFITGLHKSPFHGYSVEFAEHKIYNSGENIKHIDWKLYAKTDKLFSKRFEEETNLRCQILIDTSASMQFPQSGINKLKFSIYAAASLMLLLRKQRDAFGLSFFDEELYFNTQARSTISHQKFLFAEMEKQLQKQAEKRKTNLPQVLHELAETIHKRSLVVIFSDFLPQSKNNKEAEQLFDAFHHLKFNKHEVILFQVMDRGKEVDFNFPDQPLELIDMESGQSMKVHPSQIKEQYQRELNEFKRNLQLQSAQYKMDWIDADIAAGYFPILQSLLLKRQRMKI